jgi:hypothetical protein
VKERATGSLGWGDEAAGPDTSDTTCRGLAEVIHDAEIGSVATTSLETALSTHHSDDLVIIDLDETLWLRNSTEAFLDQARPRLVIASVLTLIDALRPWRLAGADAVTAFVWRDWLRVVLTLILTPWNYRRWRRLAPQLAWSMRNQELLALLKHHDRGRRDCGRLVVASYGFRPLVEPLVRGLLPGVPVVAASLLCGWRDRAAGKWAMLRENFDLATLARALFLTDHAEHDADVLSQVARPMVVRWPKARFEPAGAWDYAPFRYTLEAKHAEHNHLRVFLTMDVAALVLATAPVAAAPVATIVACVLLMASFFVVYEIGYHENDAMGAEREAEPMLTEPRLRAIGSMVEAKAWCMALVLAIPGLLLLATHEISAWTSDWWLLIGWLTVLLLTRGIFAAFNRIDEVSRVFLYLPLQAMKGIGIVLALALPVTVAGVALLLAQPIARWIPYVIYRKSGVRWETPDRLYRLLLFVMVLMALLPVVGVEALSPQAIVLVLAWCTLQARRQLRDAWRRSFWLKVRRFRTAADESDVPRHILAGDGKQEKTPATGPVRAPREVSRAG